MGACHDQHSEPQFSVASPFLPLSYPTLTINDTVKPYTDLPGENLNNIEWTIYW